LLKNRPFFGLEGQVWVESTSILFSKEVELLSLSLLSDFLHKGWLNRTERKLIDEGLRTQALND